MDQRFDAKSFSQLGLTGLDVDSTMYYIGGGSMAFSIRLTEEERALAESYAKIHSYSLAEAFKKALFEKIEEEYDIAVYTAAYKEYEESGKQSRPIEELWKELEI